MICIAETRIRIENDIPGDVHRAIVFKEVDVVHIPVAANRDIASVLIDAIKGEAEREGGRSIDFKRSIDGDFDRLRTRTGVDDQIAADGVAAAGKVDGSVVVALPIDKWSKSEKENSFIGHGGGITFWDGVEKNENNGNKSTTKEIHYETRSGDIAFIDR